MNVAVVSTHVPFGSSRVDDVRDELGRQLAARGHAVEAIRVPLLSRDARSVLDALVAIRFMHIRLVDLVIALDFPAYLIPHPRTVVWALSGAETVTGPEEIRPLLANAEATFLRDACAVAAADRALADRLNTDVLPVPRDDREWSYMLDRLLGYAEQRPRTRGTAVRTPLSQEALALLSEECDRVGATMAALAIEPTLPVVTRSVAVLAALGDGGG